MIERYGGLWVDPKGVAVYELYDADRDRIALICRLPDGGHQPALYEKSAQSDLQCLPFWEPVSARIVCGSQEEAAAYLQTLMQQI